MVFKKINYGAYKQEIKDLARKRLNLKDKVRYFENKSKLNLDKAKEITEVKIPEIEAELDKYMEKTAK